MNAAYWKTSLFEKLWKFNMSELEFWLNSNTFNCSPLSASRYNLLSFHFWKCILESLEYIYALTGLILEHIYVTKFKELRLHFWPSEVRSSTNNKAWYSDWLYRSEIHRPIKDEDVTKFKLFTLIHLVPRIYILTLHIYYNVS